MDNLSFKTQFEVKHSAKFGRYLTATKNIKRGELILKESPILVYPKLDETLEWDINKIECISCFRKVDFNDIIECEHCSWPFCSYDCSKDPYHKYLECELFETKMVPWTHEWIGYLYLVRCLVLQKKDSEKWKQVMNLEDNYSLENCIKDGCNRLKSEKAMKFLKECGIRISLKALHKLVNIFAINNFNITNGGDLSRNSFQREEFGALYAQSSMFAHSCAPNAVCDHFPDDTKKWLLGCFSTTDISKGEIITIAYTPNLISVGTKERRKHISDLCGFICDCSRCNDPTERGTHFSSVKCSVCRDGWLNPPAEPNKSLYICNHCNFYCVLPKSIESMENKFKDSVTDALWNPEDYQSRFKELGRLISEATTSYGLHPNHFLVIDAIEKWLYICNFEVLLESTAEVEETYKAIINRAKHALIIRRSFGTLVQQVHLELSIATAILRFVFKSTLDLPKINNNQQENTRKILNLLRELIAQEDPYLSDHEVTAFVKELEERYKD